MKIRSKVFMYSRRMPNETPKMAGTMMKTRRRVNQSVTDRPRRLHSTLSKGNRELMVWEKNKLDVTNRVCQGRRQIINNGFVASSEKKVNEERQYHSHTAISTN